MLQLLEFVAPSLEELVLRFCEGGISIVHTNVLAQETRWLMQILCGGDDGPPLFPVLRSLTLRELFVDNYVARLLTTLLSRYTVLHGEEGDDPCLRYVGVELADDWREESLHQDWWAFEDKVCSLADTIHIVIRSAMSGILLLDNREERYRE